MIAKGNLHAHGGRLAVYMMKGKGDERAELIEARGFLSDDLREAFCTIQAIAESQTRCEKPFFHVYVRLPDDEYLGQEAWLAVADRVESVLGFDDQPRAVTFHIAPDGERHIHAAWSRIDTDVMRAIDPGLYKNKLTELSRELEIEYGLRQLQRKRSPEQLTKVPARPEFEEARRLGVDVEATREIIRACYDQSDNGPSFVAALSEQHLGLARGDKRDFVVIDQEGGLHALGKRICGVSAADVRQRFGPEFSHSLPSVDEVRRRIASRDAGMAKSDDIGTDHQRSGTGMSEQSTGQPAGQLTDEMLKQQPLREAEKLAVVKELKERISAFEAQKQSAAEAARQTETERRRADERRVAEGDENDAKSRYAQALGQHYDVRDPYASLARAAMAEYGQFRRQREELQKDAARENDPAKRAEIEVRIKIEAYDYMAITSQRLAGISATIAGRGDAPLAEADRERAKFWQQEASKSRDERAKMIEARQARERPPSDRGQQPTRAAEAQPQAANESRPGSTSVALSPARRSDRETQEDQAMGPDKTQGTRETTQRTGQSAGVASGKGGGRKGGAGR